ncbi:MAG: hypothetical protein F6K22_22010 [Okeania sp. SIO2F4]|nr:hypothetical protein [Okeania sp. SIO2F4]NES05258.1 hypothetical protein [Okeania sp. SIO2F4]
MKSGDPLQEAATLSRAGFPLNAEWLGSAPYPIDQEKENSGFQASGLSRM